MCPAPLNICVYYYAYMCIYMIICGTSFDWSECSLHSLKTPSVDSTRHIMLRMCLYVHIKNIYLRPSIYTYIMHCYPVCFCKIPSMCVILTCMYLLLYIYLHIRTYIICICYYMYILWTLSTSPKNIKTPSTSITKQ